MNPDHPHSGPHGRQPPARQTAGGYRRRADDRAGAGARPVAADVGPVAVAAGDAEIVAAVRAAGGHAVLTDPALPSGSDRILAALARLDPDGRHDVVINLQGDMPFVAPAVLTACAGLLAAEPGCDIATVVAPESGAGRPHQPGRGQGGPGHGRRRRAERPGPLFHPLDPVGRGPVWRHIGVYAYRRAALERFCAAPPSPLERREKLEQLRALELGMSIWAAVVDAAPISVDTPADLDAARAYARRRTEGNESMTGRPKIAFQGEPGANGDEACRAYFPT